MRTLHVAWGTLGLLLFIATGVYMRAVVGVEHLPDGERLLYRSSHIYLMLGFACNVLLGCSLPRRKLSRLELLTSVLVLLAPAALTASFFLEPDNPGIDRPMASMALYLIFAAAALLATREALTALRGGNQAE